jgi:hypothetical protein
LLFEKEAYMRKGKRWPSDEGEDRLALEIIAKALGARAAERIRNMAGFAARRYPAKILPFDPKAMNNER